jgi:hypothetical protein
MAFVNSIQLQPIWLRTLILSCPLCTQRQTDSVYFDLSCAFNIIPHNILLHKLSNIGFSSSYVDWFYSYLDNRHSSVRISGTLSFSFLVKSGVPQGSTLGALLFNIFINDICNSIHNSRYLLFADDLKIYHTIINVDDCKLLKHDINSVYNWCLVNGMQINLGKTMIVSFSRKTNSTCFNYKLCNNLVTRSQCVKDLGVLLDCKLYFHQNIDYMLSQGLKMLGLLHLLSPLLRAFWFCTVHLLGLNWSMHLSFGIL